MKRLVILGVVACAGLLAEAASAASRDDASQTGKNVDIASANNEFALDLYGRLAAGQGNLFFSPQSIHFALGMTYAGAKGATSDQMARTLHLAAPAGQTHAGFGAFVGKLNASSKGPEGPLFELDVANSLWGQAGFPFLPSFQKIAHDQYGAQLSSVDFVKATEASRKQINDWVAQQTRDKIKDLLAPGVLNAMTRLVLVNAIYFKGAWAETFRKPATREEPFHVTANKTVNVPLMNQRHRFGYAETDSAQVLELPYTMHRLSMFVLLPKKIDGLDALEKSLDAAKLNESFRTVRSREVQVALPRFKLTSQFSLGEQLQALGMKDAFAPGEADFSGMSSAEQLFLSAVIHKAYVDVNEEGTEAAAATAVAMHATSEVMPEEPVVFKADHPFLFVIRHNETGAILFMGRVMEP